MKFYIGMRLLLAALTSAVMLWLLLEAPPALKATWIWNTRLIVQERAEILSFAAQHGINRIYLHIEQTGIPLQAYRDFIREARASNIQVDALGGDPSWSRLSKQKSVASFVDWVHAYNRSVSEEERFSGIHVDIEPHVHPLWKEDREQLKKEWLANLEWVIRETKKEPGMEVSADIPFWMHQLSASESESVSAWLLRELDHVTLMAYRDAVAGRNGVLDITSRILEEAGHARQKVVIGLNIRDSGEGDHTTFYEEPPQELREELLLLERRMKKYPAYAGFAIHDYEHWKQKIKREWEDPAARERG